MSEEYTSSVEGYAQPQSAAIARRAGIASALGAAIALAGEAVAHTVNSLLEQSRHAERELAANPFSTEEWALKATGAHLAQDLRSSRALFETLRRDEFAAIREAASLEHAGFLTSTASLLATLEQGPSIGVTITEAHEQARRLRGNLERAVEAGANRLSAAQGAEFNGALTATLRDMGYRVEPTRRQLRPGVRVTRGTSDRGTSIYVAHDSRRGHLLADMSGFSGTACEEERQRFLQLLARHGARIRLLQRRLHGSQAGGSLAGQWRQSARAEHQEAVPGCRPELRERS